MSVFFDSFVAQAVGRNLDAFAPAVEDLGHVPLRVDLDFVVMGRLALGDLRDDFDRLAGGHQAVHAGRADADALLAAAHPHAMELRAVEQLAEDQRDLLLDDARPVVLHADFEAVGAGALDVDPDFGQDAGLFAGVQGVVDRLLDGGQEGLAGVVEPEQVPVFGEKLADGDVALAGGHRLGRGAATQFGRGPPLPSAAGDDSTFGEELAVNLRDPSIASGMINQFGVAIGFEGDGGSCRFAIFDRASLGFGNCLRPHFVLVPDKSIVPKGEDYSDFSAAGPHGFSRILGIFRAFLPRLPQRFTPRTATCRDWYCVAWPDNRSRAGRDGGFRQNCHDGDLVPKTSSAPLIPIWNA